MQKMKERQAAEEAKREEERKALAEAQAKMQNLDIK